ncbi:DNA polymerase, palm domain [Cinara cedri]|uniref:DNA polymerase, palm domain n=1 Tax=Cinara cedri TaxID=506608 RepID=A0A5E4M9W7_9HEMI|nr:DNA polymerase, palm domain [Cinara cedri]
MQLKFFYEKIKDEALYIAKNYLDVKKPMIITKEQEIEFEKENNCHICEKFLSDSPPILKIPGKFKDELNGQIMTEVVGLRSKLYTYKIFENKNQIKKAKGVKKPIVKN